MYEMLRVTITYLSTVLIVTALSMFLPERVKAVARPLSTSLLTTKPELTLLSNTHNLNLTESKSILQRLQGESAVQTLTSKTSQSPLPAKIAPEWSESELDCVSQMVWGEARNQPYAGMVATAASAINRSKSGLYSRNLCAVVRELGQYKGYWGAAKPVRNAAWAPIYQAVVAASYKRHLLPSAYRKVMFFSTGNSEFHNNKQVVMKIGDHVYVR